MSSSTLSQVCFVCFLSKPTHTGCLVSVPAVTCWCWKIAGFYGGVSGLIPNKDLDLLPGQQAADVYSVGQLIRVQVGAGLTGA